VVPSSDVQYSGMYLNSSSAAAQLQESKDIAQLGSRDNPAHTATCLKSCIKAIGFQTGQLSWLNSIGEVFNREKNLHHVYLILFFILPMKTKLGAGSWAAKTGVVMSGVACVALVLRSSGSTFY